VLGEGHDELRLKVTEPKVFRNAIQAVARVLKGWQEEADPGRERRAWWWLVEGDSNADGYANGYRNPYGYANGNSHVDGYATGDRIAKPNSNTHGLFVGRR